MIREARFVHLIRDGRDVALSRAGRALRHAAPMPKVARRWKRRILNARAQGEQLGHYLEVRYEDLIVDTEPTLRAVCEFIELPWDERMLAYHERAGERLREFGDLPSAGGKPARPGEERLAAHAKTREPPDPSRLARWKTENDSRLPIVAFMAGKFMDEMPGMSFGHAGTIVEGKEDTATEKIARLGAAGITVAERIEDIPDLVKQGIAERKGAAV